MRTTPRGAVTGDLLSTAAFFCIVALVTVIGLRFFLVLVGADADSQIVQFVLRWSQPFVAPFLTVFGFEAVPQRAMLEYPDLVAIGVYLAATWGVRKAMEKPFVRPPHRYNQDKDLMGRKPN